jgi:hypothetical protein
MPSSWDEIAERGRHVLGGGDGCRQVGQPFGDRRRELPGFGVLGLFFLHHPQRLL